MSPRSIAVQPTGHISSKLEGRLIPSKGGRGLFARERVRSGEVLLVWGGDVVSGDMLKWMSEEKRRLAVQIEEDLYLVTPNEGPADWVNHSCDPNAGLVGQIVLVALRDIRMGEEICFDYATSDGSPYDEFECGCGSRVCRRHVTGDDWKLPELQRRYAGHFSPYIQRRIDRQKRNSAGAKPVRTAERRVSLSRRG
ncbi:MAG TPA: SET domain-containing protein [Candidatus Krumholzibacteria bacterium]|nr:SET domain-containing protein [Candidatus Krumholzibacteria bacterium]